MTRKPIKRSEHAEAAAPAPVAQFDPATAPSEIIEVLETKEVWSEYKLADGTLLRLRPVLAEVVKLTGQYNAEGEPIYGTKAGLIPSVRVPSELKKK